VTNPSKMSMRSLISKKMNNHHFLTISSMHSRQMIINLSKKSMRDPHSKMRMSSNIMPNSHCQVLESMSITSQTSWIR
jgi:hypothetical protein